MLCPCGAAWSLDSWLRRARGRGPGERLYVHPWPLCLLFVQMAMIYFYNGVHKLLLDYRYLSPDEKPTRQGELVKEGQRGITGEEQRPYDLTQLQKRNEGIPKLGGYLEQPIGSPLQYENVKRRFVDLNKVSTDLNVWDADDVMYVEVDKLP